jgi:hypothetical protein
MLAVRSLGFGKLRKCASRLRPEAVTAIALLGALQAFSRENSVAGNELRSVEGDPFSPGHAERMRRSSRQINTAPLYKRTPIIDSNSNTSTASLRCDSDA